MKEKLIINRVESLLDGIEGIEEECIIDSLIRIDKIGTEVHTCRECTVANIVREDMIGTVFCPVMMKRDLEFRVK